MNIHRKKSVRRILAGALTAGAFAGPAAAQLTGGTVIAGKASITETATSALIQQQSQKAIITWSRFNIPTGYGVTFTQPSPGSVTLNRVLGGGPSEIQGALSANGQVWLINPAGIIVGGGAQITVAGLLFSTADMPDPNHFKKRNPVFSVPGNPGAGIDIENGAKIVASSGPAIFVGQHVTNAGDIEAQLGDVVLAAAKTYAVDFAGDRLLSFAITTPVDSGTGPLVSNAGKIVADGGTVLMTASVVKGVLDNVINTSGIVEAQSVSDVGGKIVLSADGGGTTVSGTLDASGKGAGETGGDVEVLGDNVTLASTAKIDVSGDAGGGTALIGGGFGGKGPQTHALTSNVAAGATIDADAITSGNGGSVVVWSDGATTTAGSITARGGTTGGNGGSIETSGPLLDVAGATIDTGAARGTAGTWLLDPDDDLIDGPTASAIDAALANNDVLIETGASSLTCTGVGACIPIVGGPGNITVAADISWNTSTTLSLSAFLNIAISPGVTISNTANGSLIMRADNTGTGSGSVVFGASASVNFSAGGFVTLTYNPFDNPAGSGVNGTSFSSTVGYSGGTANYTREITLGGGASMTNFMLINTIEDFQNIANNPAANYSLSQNLDASVTASWNSGLGFTEINTFTGALLGNGFTIDRLKVSANDVFDTIGASGEVLSLRMTDSAIPSGSTVDGALALNNDGTVIGFIGDNWRVPLINNGTIADSTVASSYNVNLVNQDLAGFVNLNSGLISGSGWTGSVTDSGSNANFGGLVGFNTGTITQSYAIGTVTGGTFMSMGLIAGNNQGQISDSYAIGTVSAPSNTSPVGVLLGLNNTGEGVATSYASGVATGAGAVGALIGQNNIGAITQSYWNATLQATGVGAGSAVGAAPLPPGLPPGFNSAIWGDNAGTNNGLPVLLSQSSVPSSPPSSPPQPPDSSSGSGPGTQAQGNQGQLATNQSSGPSASNSPGGLGQSPSDNGTPPPEGGAPPPQGIAPPPGSASTPLAPPGGDQGQGGSPTLAFNDIDQGGSLFGSIAPNAGGGGGGGGGGGSGGVDGAVEDIPTWSQASSPYPTQRTDDPVGGRGSHIFAERHIVVPSNGVNGISRGGSSEGNRALWNEALTRSQ